MPTAPALVGPQASLQVLIDRLFINIADFISELPYIIGEYKDHVHKNPLTSILAVAEWIHNHGLPFTTDSMTAAASAGRLAIIELLHYNRTEGCATRAMNDAAQNGHLDVIKFLHYNRQEGCTSFALKYAAMSGHLDVTRFLHENGIARSSKPAITAVATSRRHCIKYIHEQNIDGFTARAMDGAAHEGRLEVVAFLHENHAEGCNEAALYEAAKNGHHGVVMYLCRNRPVENPDRFLTHVGKDTLKSLVVSLMTRIASPSTTKKHVYAKAPRVVPC